MQDAKGVQVLHASRNVHEAQHARTLHARNLACRRTCSTDSLTSKSTCSLL